MKRSILFVLFSLSVYAQKDTLSVEKPKLSVIGLDKVNVVYRGIPNPISIAVNDAKSYTLAGDGVSLNKEGKYVIKPGVGKETKVFVEIEKLDGTVVKEEHIFRIKGLPAIAGTLNGKDGEVILKRNEVNDALISTEITGFLYDINDDSDFFKVNSFKVKFSGEKIIQVDGNKFDNKALNEIMKLKKGEIFDIISINYGPPTDALKKKAFPIQIIIED